jgi:two-component system, NtrC family, nitrogen regulation response regulator NtrX
MSAGSVLVVDDEADIRNLVQDILADEGYEVVVAANAVEARAARKADEFDLVLLDIWMPDTDGITLLKEWTAEGPLSCPVVMMSGHGNVETAVEATRLGAANFVEKPLSLAKLLKTVEGALEKGDRHRNGGQWRLPPMLEPVGRSQAIKELRDQVKRVAQYETPVLIVGEPGTGREAFARYLHSLSSRAERPFVDCAAGSLTESNCETLLFGDAGQQGLLAKATGGVLFIDEASDLVPEVQRVLIGVLEQGSWTAGGGGDTMPLNLRVVTSARPELQHNIELGGFRRDLYSQLAVVTLHVPPLREYAEDVPELIRYYTDALVDRERVPYRRFSMAAQNRLRNYPWPGNVRELKNLVHRFLIMGGADEVSLEEVEAAIGQDSPQAESLIKQDLLAMPLREAREAFEKAYLEQQLKLCDGKVGRLAGRVGMERTHLYRKLRSLGIDIKSSGPDD